jgi:hypothetical protein
MKAVIGEHVELAFPQPTDEATPLRDVVAAGRKTWRTTSTLVYSAGTSTSRFVAGVFRTCFVTVS